MAQLRLTVQTITPLLMYGAHNKDDRVNPSLKAQPELRASSIRGTLRFWLRAVLGTQHLYTGDVFAEESNILGSTARGSRVQVRVTRNRAMEPQEELTVLPAQTRGYSLIHTGFDAGGEFRITLATHPLDRGDVLNEAGNLLKAIFLMVHMGGLGRRSRRGSGNLRVLEAKGYEGTPALAFLPQNRTELASYLGDICQFVGKVAYPSKTAPSFPVFAPNTAVVLLGQEVHDSYDDAFKELWNVSGPYHHHGGVFGDVRPRRASAIHMRVAATSSGFVAQQTILYSGSGNWNQMREYISHCLDSKFRPLYGAWEHWQ